MTKVTPLLLIDVHNLVYRSHFAAPHLAHRGEPTGMLNGFLTTMGSLRKQHGDRMAFCWDYGLPGQPHIEPWRKGIFPEYKSSRKPKDDVLLRMFEQLPALHDCLAAMGYLQFGVPGLEADDIIGILTADCGDACWIFSTDRDLYQLLGIKTWILYPNGLKKVFQCDAEGEYGISMRRWAHYLALGGDSSDDIHVLDGIGPKTALKWVKNGIDLTAPWERRGLLFDNARIESLDKATWERLQAALSVATIPRSKTDPRVARYCKGAKASIPGGYERSYDKGQADVFSGFCADRGMMELLARAREFCSPIEPRRAA